MIRSGWPCDLVACVTCEQGTSSGAPSSTRNVSSILLRTADGACLVDAGEGTCRQLAAAGVPADDVRWCVHETQLQPSPPNCAVTNAPLSVRHIYAGSAPDV